jgi:Pentapeptide repeats (8 copies)
MSRRFPTTSIVFIAFLLGLTGKGFAQVQPKDADWMQLAVTAYEGDPVDNFYLIRATVTVRNQFGWVVGRQLIHNRGTAQFRVRRGGTYVVQISHPEYEAMYVPCTADMGALGIEAPMIPLGLPRSWKPVQPLVAFRTLVLAIALGTLALIFIPRLQTRNVHADQRFERTNEARQTLIQIIGGTLIGVGALNAWNQFEDNRRRTDEADQAQRIAALYNRQVAAVSEMEKTRAALFSSTPLVRIGAISSLPHVTGPSDAVRAEAFAIVMEALRSADTRDVRRPARERRALLEVAAELAGGDGALDLSDTNLSNLNLEGINLDRANLSHANLRGANLSHATMRWARLDGALLGGTRLTGADLSDADVGVSAALLSRWSQVDLTGAALERLKAPPEFVSWAQRAVEGR